MDRTPILKFIRFDRREENAAALYSFPTFNFQSLYDHDDSIRRCQMTYYFNNFWLLFHRELILFVPLLNKITVCKMTLGMLLVIKTNFKGNKEEKKIHTNSSSWIPRFKCKDTKNMIFSIYNYSWTKPLVSFSENWIFFIGEKISISIYMWKSIRQKNGRYFGLSDSFFWIR